LVLRFDHLAVELGKQSDRLIDERRDRHRGGIARWRWRLRVSDGDDEDREDGGS
jgi:hypothetical protein